jgi:hypothetical protein
VAAVRQRNQIRLKEGLSKAHELATSMKQMIFVQHVIPFDTFSQAAQKCRSVAAFPPLRVIRLPFVVSRILGEPHERQVEGDAQMHPEGSVTRWTFGRVRLHRLSAVPALLICYAVVFNIGPFAKAPQREVAQRSSQQSIAAAPVARPQAALDGRLDPPQSMTDVTGGSELIGSADDNVARTLPQPVNLTANGPVPAIPTLDTQPPNAPAQQATIEGIWAPNASSCSLRDLRDGSLATIIDMGGARAGDTYCAFKKQQRTPTGWRVVAECSNSLERWTANVRLTVKDDHLLWTSRRGRQIYTRCAPDAVMTAAR